MTPLLPHVVHAHSSSVGVVVGQASAWPPQDTHRTCRRGWSNGGLACSADSGGTLPLRLFVVVRAWLAPGSYAAGFFLSDLTVEVYRFLVR